MLPLRSDYGKRAISCVPWKLSVSSSCVFASSISQTDDLSLYIFKNALIPNHKIYHNIWVTCFGLGIGLETTSLRGLTASWDPSRAISRPSSKSAKITISSLKLKISDLGIVNRWSTITLIHNSAMQMLKNDGARKHKKEAGHFSPHFIEHSVAEYRPVNRPRLLAGVPQNSRS